MGQTGAQLLIERLLSLNKEEKIVDLLHNNRNEVNASLFQIFMDPQISQLYIPSFKSVSHFQLVGKLVGEQYTRNIVDQYLRTPEEVVPEYVRPLIRMLLLEYSFDYLISLISYFKKDTRQSAHIKDRLHLLVDIAVDYLIFCKEPDQINMIIQSGPSYYTNPLAFEILNSRATDSRDYAVCMYIVQSVTDFRNQLASEKIVNQEVKKSIAAYFAESDPDAKIEMLTRAIDLSGKESGETLAFLQLLLSDAYLNRSKGLPADNSKRALNHLINAESFFTPEKYPYRWSTIQNAFGRLYAFLQEGNAANNIEHAIQCFNNALTGFPEEEAPYDRALTHNNLGSAYLERTYGNKKENISKARAYFEAALTIQNPEYTPQEWAMTMMNLGDACNNKYGAERLDTVHEAIEYYYEACSIYTKEENPVAWAKVQVKIADAYHTLSALNRSENLEKAIGFANDALTVLNSTDHIHEWATAKSTLSKFYLERVAAERMANIETALSLLEEVLPVHQKEKHPYNWAMNQLGMAHCLRVRLRGSGEENFQRAINHVVNALEILQPDKFPIDWASAQHLLGILYYERPKTDKGSDYDYSVNCFKAALKVRTIEAVPNSWMESMNSLGNSYRKRIAGTASENLEKALDCFQQILNKAEYTNNPMLMAVVQYNCGLVYRDRISGIAEENENNAINLFTQALNLHLPELEPIQCFKTAVNLGKLYYQQKDYLKSCNTLKLAHQSIEYLRAQSEKEISRRMLAAEAGDMYEVLVASCIKSNDIASAFYYAMAAKARVFNDKLGYSAQNPDELLKAFPALTAEWNKISMLRNEINSLTLQYGSMAQHAADLRSLVAAKRAQLAALVENLYYDCPQLSISLPVPVHDPEAIIKLSSSSGNIPLVEYFKSASGWGAFIVWRGSINFVELPGVSDQELNSILDTLSQYESGVMAGRSPDSFINQLADSLGSLYLHLFKPLEPFLPDNGKLVLAPSRQLHQLPFCIAYDPGRYQYLIDRYTISYIPSLGVLENLRVFAERKGKSSKGGSLLSVAYSAKDIGKPLRFAIKEAQEVARHFELEPRSVYLFEQDATTENVVRSCNTIGFDTVHFSCHGQFNFSDPSNSGLLLKGGVLTAERVMTELRLQQLPMVILSACQSGLSLSQEGDEAIGITQSFFNAGAGMVISGQWSVEDKATQVLFTKFFENRKTMNEPEALRQAMLAIRAKSEWNYPVYWAAFKVNGLIR